MWAKGIRFTWRVYNDLGNLVTVKKVEKVGEEYQGRNVVEWRIEEKLSGFFQFCLWKTQQVYPAEVEGGLFYKLYR